MPFGSYLSTLVSTRTRDSRGVQSKGYTAARLRELSMPFALVKSNFGRPDWSPVLRLF
jgi:hypothetical protein